MSYRGRPSKGCEGCRTRKVKCDEAKPSCNRCSKSNYECRYRDQGDILFRNQTAVAAQRAEDSWRKRSKSHQRARSDSTCADSIDQVSSTKTRTQKATCGDGGKNASSSAARKKGKERVYEPAISPDLSKLAIAPSIVPDLRRIAYERFLYDFVAPETPNRPPDEASDGLYTFVPILYENAHPNSCIATVIEAVAYVNFSNRFKSSQAALLGEEAFGKGVTALSSMITNPKLAPTDEALGSAYLMSVFENLTRIQRKGTFIAHQHGANALLQLRTIDQYYQNPVSARIYEVAYSQMLLGNLQAGKAPPLPVDNVVSVRQHMRSLYNDSDVFVIKLIWQEAMLHSLWLEEKQKETPPTTRSTFHEMLQAALDLDAEYRNWEASPPAIWGYKAYPNTAEARSVYDPKWQKLLLGSRGAPEEIHEYPKLVQCFIWGYFRTARMFLLRDILEMINWMLRMPEPDDIANRTRTDSAQNLDAGSMTPDKARQIGLDSFSLYVQYSLTSMYLIDLMERTSSSILGAFTVPVAGKSYEDVMGMRGYVVLWPIAIMDSILSAGLVPDTEAALSPPYTGSSTSQPPSTFSPNAPETSPPPQAFYDDVSMATPEHGFRRPPMSDINQQQYQSVSPPPSRESSYTHQTTPSYIDDPTDKAHAFDPGPRHPYDSPIDLPMLDFQIPKLKSIDVDARREMLNRMLYYIGTELGVKKAVAVPYMEGFLHIVKPQVEAALV